MPGLFRYLFIDMNSFFASVEQQVQPALRGKPVGIVPIDGTDATCCIAASYEAKACGVKTGTSVPEARRRCPQIQLTLARPRLYVQFHHRIIRAVESALHVEQVCSIDEMYGRLMSNERSPQQAAAIAERIKRAIAAECGPHVRCSIGIGPNIWLSKIATDLQKPDGLVLLSIDELPARLSELKLTDLPGVGRNMAVRLAAHGITTVEQLWSLRESQLHRIWASRVLGSIWYAQMRGEALPYRPTQRRSVSHSHVLAPRLRTHELAYQVMIRMLHKAARRMRRLGYCAGAMSIYVRCEGGRRWETGCDLSHAYDTLTLVHHAARLWPAHPIGAPMKVAVVLLKLETMTGCALPLFEPQRRMNRLAETMDAIAWRFGRDAVFSGAMFAARGSAPTRISFTQVPDDAEFDSADVGYVGEVAPSS
ncbi:MAG: DNA polymerase [Phycisphaeraceae bacterium]|nr:DNA polymerase [Phycisphaeraceae bacterium]